MTICNTSYSPALRGFWYKKGYYFILCLALLNITACDVLNFNKRTTSKDLPPPFTGNAANDAKNAASSHKIGSPQISIEKVRDIARAAPNNSQTTINNTRSLEPSPLPVLSDSDLVTPTDLSTNQLFTYGTTDTNERFERLEKVVQAMSNDFKTLKPSIERLVVIENDLENITFQLENLLKQEQVVETTHTKTIPFVEPDRQIISIERGPIYTLPERTTQTSYKAPKSYINPGNLIHTMRVADHKDKTRVVFETTKALDYEVSIDNGERLVAIQFDQGSLGSDPNSLSRFSKLFKSIAHVQEGEGSLIVFELEKDTEILTKQRIKPNKHSSNHRIFIDFKR